MHQTENKYVYEYIRLLIANGKQINSDDCDSAGGADIAMWLHKEENSHAQSLILLCCTRFFILFLINYHNAVLIGAKTYWCIPITINENERDIECNVGILKFIGCRISHDMMQCKKSNSLQQ